VTTTLLAVDDSKTMRQVLEITFSGEDIRAILAATPDEALNELKSQNPSVALVDAHLDNASGYDLCQQIKQQAPAVAVILLTSKHQPYDRARGGAVGVDDFVDKPFDTQQLIDKVRAIAAKGVAAPAARPAAPAAAPAARPAAPAVPAQPAAADSLRQRTHTLSYGSPTPAPAAVPTAPKPLAAQPAASVKAPLTQPIGTAQRPLVTPAVPLQPRPVAPAAQPAAQPRPAPAAVQPMAARPAVPAAAQAPSPAVSPTVTRPQAPAEPAAPKPVVTPAAAAAVAVAPGGDLATQLEALGLTREQVQGVLALSRDVIEKVVWEVVPTLAETLIKEEIRRLTSE
jgi:CheY-like chemotaxis protein